MGHLKHVEPMMAANGGDQHVIEIVTRPPVTPALQYGPVEMTVQCPHCTAIVLTRVSYSTGLFSYVAAYILMLMCCCLCCLIPCCCKGFKNAEHTCPKCGGYLGTYTRL